MSTGHRTFAVLLGSLFEGIVGDGLLLAAYGIIAEAAGWVATTRRDAH